MILVLVKLMSEPDVPTVRPVTISVPPDAVRMRAAAAVPVASALVSDFGKPENVKTPPEVVPAVEFNEIVAKIEAIPVVPISSTPVDPIAVTTASNRAFFTAGVYVTAIFVSPLKGSVRRLDGKFLIIVLLRRYFTIAAFPVLFTRIV